MSTEGDYCGPQFYLWWSTFKEYIYLWNMCVCVYSSVLQVSRLAGSCKWWSASGIVHTTEGPMSSTCTSRCLESWLKNTWLLNWMFWGLFNILMMIKFLCPYFPFQSTSPNVSSTLKNCRFHRPPPYDIAGSIYKFNRPCLKLELQLIANW